MNPTRNGPYTVWRDASDHVHDTEHALKDAEQELELYAREHEQAQEAEYVAYLGLLHIPCPLCLAPAHVHCANPGTEGTNGYAVRIHPARIAANMTEKDTV
jgi:hypothetical protein